MDRMKQGPCHLSDIPCGEDYFANHAQNKIADILVKYLDTNQDCRQIGIDGPWGSGKSNLVKILERKLSSHHFFVYDAWAHQTDYQRRAIIEEFLAYLQREGLLVLDDQLKEQRDDVLGSRTTSRTESNSNFSWGTFWVLCSVLVSPAFAALASVIYCPWTRVVVGAMPLFFLGAAFLVAVWSHYQKEEKGQSRGFWADIRDHMISSTKKDATCSSKHEYSQTANPSTVSFYNFFASVQDRLKSKLKKNESLIIVIDNIDRLPSEKIQEVWTMLQSCFNTENMRSLSKFRVIVPFDRNHLNLFDESGNERVTKAYLDKTFDVVFRVPLPVLNDWESYFNMMWEKAFGAGTVEQNKQELDIVRHVFDCYTEEIMPRRILTFINEMVTLSLLDEKHEIKQRYQAVFICRQDKILEDPLKALTDLKYLRALENQFSRDEMYFKAISALSYQVPLERGEEVAIYRSLTHALAEGDQKIVAQIANIPSFPSILGEVLNSFKVGDDLHNAIVALDCLTTDKVGGAVLAENRWNQLYESVIDEIEARQHMVNEAEEQGYLEPYIKALFKHCSAEQCKKLITLLLSVYEHLGSRINASRYHQTIDDICELVQNKDIDVFAMLKDIEVPSDSMKHFLEEQHDFSNLSRYRMRAPNKEMIGYLNKTPVGALAQIRYLPFLASDGYDMTAFLERCQNQLRDCRSMDELVELLLIGLAAVPDGKCLDLKGMTWKDSSLLQQINSELASPREVGVLGSDRSALIGFSFLKFRYRDIEGYSNLKKAFDGTEDVVPFCAVLPKLLTFGELLCKSELFAQSNLYREVCRYMTANLTSKYQLDLIKIMPNLTDIIHNTGLQEEVLLTKLGQFATVEDVENIPTALPISTLKILNKHTDEFSKTCLTMVRKYLDQITRDEWDEYVDNGVRSYPFQAGLEVGYVWDDDAKGTVYQYLENMIREEESPEDINEWQELINSMCASGFELDWLLRKLADSLHGREITHEELLFWGDWLFKENILKVDLDTLRRITPDDVLSDDQCLDIFIRHDGRIREIYHKADQSSQKVFAQKIRDAAPKNEKAAKIMRRVLGELPPQSKAGEN